MDGVGRYAQFLHASMANDILRASEIELPQTTKCVPLSSSRSSVVVALNHFSHKTMRPKRPYIHIYLHPISFLPHICCFPFGRIINPTNNPRGQVQCEQHTQTPTTNISCIFFKRKLKHIYTRALIFRSGREILAGGPIPIKKNENF